MSSQPDENSMAKTVPTMHLRLWLTSDEGLLFGPGRADLLDMIDRMGSLRQAAKEIGISYRAAWGKIRRTEQLLGFKLVDKAGSYKEGYQLTEAGRQMKEKFNRWYKEIEDDALRKAKLIFMFEDIGREKEAPRLYPPDE